jgi:carbohydrate-binding DOMON domain-containing protein
MNWIARRVLVAVAAGGLIAAMAAAAAAQEVIFSDPAGDDNGPGKYTYPTDPAFSPGAFDLAGFRLKAKGDTVDVEVSFASKLTDPWKTGTGFSLQLIFIFIQTEARAVLPAAVPSPGPGPGTAGGAGGSSSSAAPSATGIPAGAALPGTGISSSAIAPGGAATPPASPNDSRTPAPASGARTAAGGPTGTSGPAKQGAKSTVKPAPKPTPGITEGLPGLNIRFAPEQAWDRCVILAPDPQRLRQEIEAKVPAALRSAIIVPSREKGSGHTIAATFDRKALGQGNPKDWGFQVVVASYDPYPARESLLVRRVDQTESQYRFGGGSNGDCDPNVLDLLAGTGSGQDGEAELQHQMLQFECKPGIGGRKLAALTMVHIKKELTREEKRAKKKEDEEKKRKEDEAKQPGAQVPP